VVHIPLATDVEEVRESAGGARVGVAAVVLVVGVVPNLSLGTPDGVDVEKVVATAGRVGSLQRDRRVSVEEEEREVRRGEKGKKGRETHVVATLVAGVGAAVLGSGATDRVGTP
jgi:hypothetical protein